MIDTLKYPLYVSVVEKLEQCSSCSAMNGQSGTSSWATFSVVIRDSITGKIVICSSCKRNKNKAVFDL